MNGLSGGLRIIIRIDVETETGQGARGEEEPRTGEEVEETWADQIMRPPIETILAP